MPADPNLPGREDNTMSPPPSGITLQMLERHFDKNLKDAARDLGVGMTTLKRTCRHFGIAKWPRRTLKCKREKLQEALETLRSEGAATASPDGRVGVTIDGAFHGVNVCARGFAMIPGRPLDRTPEDDPSARDSTRKWIRVGATSPRAEVAVRRERERERDDERQYDRSRLGPSADGAAPAPVFAGFKRTRMSDTQFAGVDAWGAPSHPKAKVGGDEGGRASSFAHLSRPAALAATGGVSFANLPDDSDEETLSADEMRTALMVKGFVDAGGTRGDGDGDGDGGEDFDAPIDFLDRRDGSGAVAVADRKSPSRGEPSQHSDRSNKSAQMGFGADAGGGGVVFKLHLDSGDVLRFRMLADEFTLSDVVSRAEISLQGARKAPRDGETATATASSLDAKTTRLTYEDDEGDWCVLVGDGDLREAVSLATRRGAAPDASPRASHVHLKLDGDRGAAAAGGGGAFAFASTPGDARRRGRVRGLGGSWASAAFAVGAHETTFTVKASVGRDVVRFTLPPSATTFEDVASRIEDSLDDGKRVLRFKYADESDETCVLAGDADLDECRAAHALAGKSTMRLHCELR